MPPQPYRHRRDPYSKGQVQRTVERSGERVELTFLARDGGWEELLDRSDPGSWIASPGARNITIEEYVGTAARHVRHYGNWIEIRKDVASSDPQLLLWCRRHANSELRSGALRLKPDVWERRRREEIDLPFIPEFDHPDREIRALAGTEAGRRRLAFLTEQVAERHRVEVLAASQAGHSRRSLGRLLGLSFGRVQQIIVEARAAKGS